jgi:hypothetical protein
VDSTIRWPTAGFLPRVRSDDLLCRLARAYDPFSQDRVSFLFRTSQPVDYFRPIFTNPTQPKYNASDPIMAGQKPKRGTPAIMETT